MKTKKLQQNNKDIFPITIKDAIVELENTTFEDYIIKDRDDNFNVSPIYNTEIQTKATKEDSDTVIDEFRKSFDSIFEKLEEKCYPNPIIRYTTIDGQKIDKSSTRIENYIQKHYWNEKEQAFYIEIDQNIEEFPDYAFSGLSDKLVEISFEKFNNLKKIGDYFLSEIDDRQWDIIPIITSIFFGDMPNLESIGNYFINLSYNDDHPNGIYNESLKNISFGKNYNIKSIGDDFLSYCDNLDSVDLSLLSKVASIGDYFLRDCYGLTSIDLAPLSNIKSIPNYFLSGCSGLGSIDLSPLSQVTSIGNNFLSYCFGLVSVDLSPLSNIISIPNYFLGGCRNLASIDLSPLSNVTSIGNSFLSNCYNLTSIDLSPLSQVASIGNDFLYYCNSLTSIDLSPLSQVTTIVGHFLSNCSGLTSIDLSPLSQVTSIGNYFLFNCSALTSIDLSPLSQVTSIGDKFLYRCSTLVSVDLSPLSQVSYIGNYFLEECSGLTSIISPMDLITSKIYKAASPTLYWDVIHNITSLTLLGSNLHTSLGTQWNGNYINRNLKIYIPEDLLERYREQFQQLYYRFYCIEHKSQHLDNIPKTYIKYTTIDNKSISNDSTKIQDYIHDHYWNEEEEAFYIEVTPTIKEFPNNTFYNCSTLVTIEFNNFNNLTDIGDYFIAKSSNDKNVNLISVNLGFMPKLNTIGKYFLGVIEFSGAIGHQNLKYLNISNINKVTSIGDYFLYYCSGLDSVDLSPLSQVTSIGNYFLGYCLGLTSIDLSPLSSVTSIGNYFLYVCKSLASIDLSPLSSVTSIGNYFLNSCFGLSSINLSPLSSVTSIGNYFLSTSHLVSIDLSPLSSVTFIGNYFLYGCSELVKVISPTDSITSKIYKDPSPTNYQNTIYHIMFLTLLGLDIHTSLGTQWEDGHINRFLSIYVPEDLIEEYKSTFTELADRFYVIT